MHNSLSEKEIFNICFKSVFKPLEMQNPFGFEGLEECWIQYKIENFRSLLQKYGLENYTDALFYWMVEKRFYVNSFSWFSKKEETDHLKSELIKAVNVIFQTEIDDLEIIIRSKKLINKKACIANPEALNMVRDSLIKCYNDKQFNIEEQTYEEALYSFFTCNFSSIRRRFDVKGEDVKNMSGVESLFQLYKKSHDPEDVRSWMSNPDTFTAMEVDKEYIERKFELLKDKKKAGRKSVYETEVGIIMILSYFLRMEDFIKGDETNIESVIFTIQHQNIIYDILTHFDFLNSTKEKPITYGYERVKSIWQKSQTKGEHLETLERINSEINYWKS